MGDVYESGMEESRGSDHAPLSTNPSTSISAAVVGNQHYESATLSTTLKRSHRDPVESAIQTPQPRGPPVSVHVPPRRGSVGSTVGGPQGRGKVDDSFDNSSLSGSVSGSRRESAGGKGPPSSGGNSEGNKKTRKSTNAVPADDSSCNGSVMSGAGSASVSGSRSVGGATGQSSSSTSKANRNITVNNNSIQPNRTPVTGPTAPPMAVNIGKSKTAADGDGKVPIRRRSGASASVSTTSGGPGAQAISSNTMPGTKANKSTVNTIGLSLPLAEAGNMASTSPANESQSQSTNRVPLGHDPTRRKTFGYTVSGNTQSAVSNIVRKAPLNSGTKGEGISQHTAGDTAGSRGGREDERKHDVSIPGVVNRKMTVTPGPVSGSQGRDSDVGVPKRRGSGNSTVAKKANVPNNNPGHSVSVAVGGGAAVPSRLKNDPSDDDQSVCSVGSRGTVGTNSSRNKSARRKSNYGVLRP